MSATNSQAAAIRGFGLSDEDLEAWRSSGLGGDGFVDWLIDRVARRPRAADARRTRGGRAADIRRR